MAYIRSINTNHPVMTAWNTVLTRILKFSLSLVGKNSLNLISGVCRGLGRKGVDTCVWYSLSLHQHFKSFFPWPYISCVLNLRSAHIFSSWMCSVFFPPDKSSAFKSVHLYFIIIALLNAVSLREGVLFLPLSSVENFAPLYFLPISLRSWGKKWEHILWRQVLEIHLLTK